MTNLQLALITDPSLAELAKRLHQATLRRARILYLPHQLAADEVDRMLTEADEERVFCATALALSLPNQRRAIVGRHDETGKWEIQREHGNHITSRPYIEPEWETLAGDQQADYEDEP
jgi:hypothetical protein